MGDWLSLSDVCFPENTYQGIIVSITKRKVNVAYGIYVEIEVIDFYVSSRVDLANDIAELPRVRATCLFNSPPLQVSNGKPDLFKARVNRCALHLKPKQSEQECDADSGLNGLFISIAPGESFPAGVQAEVFVYVENDIFEKLVDDMQRGGKCLISFKTSGPNIELESDFRSTPIQDVEFRFQTTLLPGKSATTAASADYEKVVDECCLPGQRYGNLIRTIGSELALSLAKGKAVPTMYELEQFGELLDRLKRGFHPYFLGDGLPDGLFEKEPAEFEKALTDFPETEKSVLRASYSMVWLHTPMDLITTKGELNTGIAKNHLMPNLEVIEELGQLYCSNPNFISPHLEWVIVDSLMYSEVLGFVRSLAQENRMLAYDKPLGPVGIKKQVIDQATHTLGRVAKEVFAWVLTGVAASLIGQLSNLGFWPIFLGITAVRWVRSTRDYKTANVVERVKLASDMAAAYSKLSTFEFNAGLMLVHLHALEIRGASFKAAIYNVLEKRQIRARC